MDVNVDKALCTLERVRHLTGSVYVLRFSRNNVQFLPGQYLLAGLPGTDKMKEYSIYSGQHDPYLEILIREVDDGKLSRELKKIRPGDKLEVRGPYGFFLSNSVNAEQEKRLFISSGTGIAPFHSFVKSYPGLDYRLIHGVRTPDEAYDQGDYRKGQLVLCTSQDPKGDFHGRVTDYLSQLEMEPDQQVYLCGGSHMIHDAVQILLTKGIPQSQIFTEIYF